LDSEKDVEEMENSMIRGKLLRAIQSEIDRKVSFLDMSRGLFFSVKRLGPVKFEARQSWYHISNRDRKDMSCRHRQSSSCTQKKINKQVDLKDIKVDVRVVAATNKDLKTK